MHLKTKKTEEKNPQQNMSDKGDDSLVWVAALHSWQSQHLFHGLKKSRRPLRSAADYTDFNIPLRKYNFMDFSFLLKMYNKILTLTLLANTESECRDAPPTLVFTFWRDMEGTAVAGGDHWVAAWRHPGLRSVQFLLCVERVKTNILWHILCLAADRR